MVMLKKLRLKFILINMTIVTLMLLIIFGLLYISTGRSLQRESLQMMDSIIMNPKHLPPPVMNKNRAEETKADSLLKDNVRDHGDHEYDNRPDDVTGEGRKAFFDHNRNEEVRLPYFSIRLNPEGEITDIYGGFFDLSDEELLQEILARALDLPKATGILEEYDLRFLKKDNPMGTHLVFVDTTNERAILRDLIKTFLLIGSAAFLVFLGISILLARWAVRPVEKAWQQQKQFVADASHELKTPLTVIMTDAELLRSPECSSMERQQLSDSIITMSQQMRGLVEGLLDLARLDKGNPEGNLQQLSLSEVVQEAAMLFEPVFFESSMPFTYDISPDITLRGDRAHLKQVVDIMLDNASKYASPGGEVKLSLERSGGNKCLLTVSNVGDPIEDEDLKNLFNRFYRADKARSSRHSYGLGLSIAESIAREHKGKMWAESRDGYNSFYMELPIGCDR